jgi:hypothetical protein
MDNPRLYPQIPDQEFVIYKNPNLRRVSMYIIGENIHIISEKVKEALLQNTKFFQELAIKQVEAGAQALDNNLGPRKKWRRGLPWMVESSKPWSMFPSVLIQPTSWGLKPA